MRMRNPHTSVIVRMIAAVICAAAILSAAAAGEVIRSFDCVVEIRQDGTQAVTEIIRFVAGGNQIKRGIFRDLPLRTASGNRASFAVESFIADGATSRNYEVQRRPGGVRIVMGDKNRRLVPGEHVFVLTYVTSGHVRFFDGYAELGWNVTGDKWAFVIEKASCRVIVPPGGGIEDMTGWLGETGSRDSPIAFSQPEPGTALFVAEQAIPPGRHFTVAVRFPGDTVYNPAQGELARTIVVLLLAFAYYYCVWRRWGKDPKPGTIIPRFYPPEADDSGPRERGGKCPRGVVSAAAASYLKHAARLDIRGFASVFVSLAAQGLCRIRNGLNDTFVLTPLRADAAALDALPPEERAAYDRLVPIAGTDRDFVLSNDNAKDIHAIHDDVLGALNLRYSSLWAQNIGIQVLGWLVVFPIAVLALNGGFDGGAEALAPPIVLAGIIFFVRKQIAYYWCRTIGSPNPLKAVSYAIVFVALAASHLRVVSLISTGIGLFLSGMYGLSVATVILVAIPMIFCPEMKAPSLAGRRLLDQIDGLLMYIDTAEKDRLQAMNPPEETPEVFERLLPYAVAFGLEETWCSRFADKLAVERPVEGSGTFSDTADLGRLFRGGRGYRFGNAIAAASVAPSSSGGGSDGGSSFSGGGGGAGSGGGGGGGGGW